MAVNLLRRHDLAQAETLLSASFAQFQADRSVAGSARKLVELEEGMRGYGRNLVCDHGDWPGYWAMRRELSRLEKSEAKQRKRRADAELKGGISTGYKTPKTTDLYDGITGFGGQGTSPFAGNPDLQPDDRVLLKETLGFRDVSRNSCRTTSG